MSGLEFHPEPTTLAEAIERARAIVIMPDSWQPANKRALAMVIDAAETMPHDTIRVHLAQDIADGDVRITIQTDHSHRHTFDTLEWDVSLTTDAIVVSDGNGKTTVYPLASVSEYVAEVIDR